ncbi:MAG: VWA domain-containing protein [Desulfobacteraceae bacterium]|nr:VWA domain-containing protein [Desulfobacteraceae bacterium]
MFRFASPYAFLLLLLIPVIVWYRRRQRPATLAATAVHSLKEIGPSPALTLHRLLPGIYYLVIILLILALARPQWGTRRLPQESEGINIILALDLSGSMGAIDFSHGGQILNRLQAVKLVVRQFIAERSGDRIGVVVFGSQAYTQLPLTRDYQTIAAILDRLEIGMAGPNTAIGDAIGISIKRITDVKSRSNVIILLSDGSSNSGELEPQTATEIAKEKGVKIYTIGVGTTGRAPFLINDPIFGQREIYQQVEIDEKTLKSIADTTGGSYFHARDLEGLKQIYATIDAMEKTKVEVQSYADYNELYLYLLLPAFGLLAVWILLKNTRFLEIP